VALTAVVSVQLLQAMTVSNIVSMSLGGTGSFSFLAASGI
jgi:hypothetical protein